MTKQTKKNSRAYIIGLLLILLGIGIFIFGVSMFTYQGNSLSPFINTLGECSFFCWLPVIFVGACVIIGNHIVRRI